MKKKNWKCLCFYTTLKFCLRSYINIIIINKRKYLFFSFSSQYPNWIVYKISQNGHPYGQDSKEKKNLFIHLQTTLTSKIILGEQSTDYYLF